MEVHKNRVFKLDLKAPESSFRIKIRKIIPRQKIIASLENKKITFSCFLSYKYLPIYIYFFGKILVKFHTTRYYSLYFRQILQQKKSGAVFCTFTHFFNNLSIVVIQKLRLIIFFKICRIYI